MQPNPHYEAGFIRAVDHADPEDLLMERERQARVRRMAMVAVVAVVACIGIGFGIAASGDSPAKQQERGKRLSAGNAHQEAIVEYKRSLLGDPTQPAVRVLLGQEYALLGDPKAAEIEFRKALDLKYEPERTLPLLAAALVQQERFEKVVALVNDATLESPAANADLQALLGTAYSALGRDTEARAAWKAATDFVPSHPGALLAEARALAAHGGTDEATALLDRLPASGPQQREAMKVRGDIARAQGRLAEAATAYEAAVSLDPGDLPLLASLAQTSIDLGRFDDAKRQVDAILLASPDNPKAQYLAARAAVGHRDFRTAHQFITQSIQIAPRDGRAQLLAGTIAVEMAASEEAEVHLREAVALMPKNREARRTLAEFYVLRHLPARAEETIAPLFATAPDDRRVADVVARIALLQGDAAKAAKAYDQVDPARPDHVDASLKAAALKFAAGDTAGGFARLRAAGAASPGNVDVDVALVAAWLQLRQPKEALAAWNALARKRPDAARTYDVLSTIELASGNRAAARRSLEKAASLDAKDFDAIGGLAKLDVDEQKVDDATDRLRRFIASDGVDTTGRLDAVMRLVQIERTRGGRDDAVLDLLRDARKTDPRSTRIAQALAGWHVEHGDPKQALGVADEGLAFAPGDPSLLEIAATASLAAGNPARATTIFKALTTMHAESTDYPMRLGGAWLSAGDPEAALAAFRLVLSRQPERVDLHRAMVGSLLTAGKADEAARLLFEINRLAPKSTALPELDADVKLARRQYPEAIAAYRHALELTPTSALAIRTYEGLTKARQPGEANALLAGWLKAHPADEAVRLFDAEVALRSMDYGRASDDFRALLRLRPNDPALLRRLAASDAQTADPAPSVVAERAGAPALRNAAMGER